MTKPLTQIGSEVREMTDAEYTQWQIDNETLATETADAAATRASGLAKLKALGLTDAEVAALVGG